MQTNNQAAKQSETAARSVIDIELLALDLNSCTRCVETLDHIEKAIDIIQPVLEVMETQVNVKRIVVESEEQARRYQFVTSPTIRVNGKDIAFETLESECESCTDLCGCDERTRCRVWRYRGEEYTEAPVGLVVESILREIFGNSRGAMDVTAAYSEVPENLRRFFRSKSDARPAAETCCSPTKRETCCGPGEESACCDASQPETCGCR
jgi:hypothetical protein